MREPNIGQHPNVTRFKGVVTPLNFPFRNFRGKYCRCTLQLDPARAPAPRNSFKLGPGPCNWLRLSLQLFPNSLQLCPSPFQLVAALISPASCALHRAYRAETTTILCHTSTRHVLAAFVSLRLWSKPSSNLTVAVSSLRFQHISHGWREMGRGSYGRLRAVWNDPCASARRSWNRAGAP